MKSSRFYGKTRKMYGTDFDRENYRTANRTFQMAKKFILTGSKSYDDFDRFSFNSQKNIKTLYFDLFDPRLCETTYIQYFVKN